MTIHETTYASRDSNEGAFNVLLTRAYALNWEVIAYTVILVLALVTRFAGLGDRVMSHDESLHTYYSWRLYEFGEFSHTPLMHGPVLFHMVALSYFMFGDNDFTARIYPAALGVLIVLYPLLLRRWLGRLGAVLASVLLLISPMLMYYNRYIREDTPSIFYTIIAVYAILQYVDGLPPRRSIWLWVLSGSLLLTLASKEVAFMYVAIFAAFLLFIWLMRVVQDIGIAARPAERVAGLPRGVGLAVGHLILFVVVGVVIVTLGRLIRHLISPVMWIPSDAWIEFPLFLVLYVPLALYGSVRGGWASSFLTTAFFTKDDDRPKRSTGRGGVAAAIMRGLSHGKTALILIGAGLIIGAILALWIACVADVIKPEQVWTETTVRSQYDELYGGNTTKEFATSVGFDSAMFIRLITWVGLPVLVILFLVFITAVLRFPGDVPLPWREMLIIVLVAFIATSVLVLFERRSFVENLAAQPFAASLTATAHENGEYDNRYIVAVWVLGGLATLVVLATRFLTNWWDFFNRQPLFDVLVLIFTLVLPWAAAFPLYWAGYNLETYDINNQQGEDTLYASARVIIPFFLLSASIGLSWNWKRWLPATAIFLGLFGFFFTTVFSNQYGLVTGMIGSLGYWLEQQGVRRGSQPQYYYMLTQLPVYEFLPMLASMCAGVYGLSSLWRWRRTRAEAALIAAREDEYYAPAVDEDTLDDVLPSADQTLISNANRTQAFSPPAQDEQEGTGGGGVDDDDMPDEISYGVSYEPPEVPPLLRPFDWKEEQDRRRDDPEWIGAFPVLLMIGWWAVTIILALTIAGEKMPWLTTHMTVPLALLSGWWLGRVAEGVRWRGLGSGEGLLLVVVLPLAFLALWEVVLGFWEGDPFSGYAIDDLMASGNWLAALLVFLGALYVVGRFGGPLGIDQIGRLALLSGALVLGVLTARAAILASFVNFDYATEYLVYAHSGPAVKTVMRELDRIAELTNEDSNMRIVFDDESSWPLTWYLRDYPNYGYLQGEAGSVNPSQLDGARVVIVGNKKAGDVRRILGDRYYEFHYIRLWWPMQEYFYVNYDRVANAFSTDENNVAARYFRKGMWDIWLNRDYQTYAQAMCIEAKQFRCADEANYGTDEEERDQFRQSCQQAVIAECANDDRFEVRKWPVSDALYFFVDKQIAAQIWDAGIGSSTVNIREPQYPEDNVYVDIQSEVVIGVEAALSGPRGIATDEDGLIYIADTDRSRIAVLDSTGQEVGSIGGPPNSPELGGLKQPWGVDIGLDGNVYVADTWNNRVAVFTRQGEFLRAWGHEGVPQSDASIDAMWGPREIKIGPEGYVYVADTGGKRIRVYQPDGTFVRDIGSSGTGLGQLDEPVGLAFNPISGELYVAEAWNRRIQVFDRNGLPLRTFDVNMWFRNRNSFNRPYIAVSPDGTLIYVTDMDDRHRIVAYKLDGQPIFSFNQPDDLQGGTLGVRAPAGMAFDEAGRLYVVDSEQAKVFVFPPSEVTGDILPVPAEGLAPPAGASPDLTEEIADTTPEVTDEVTDESAE